MFFSRTAYIPKKEVQMSTMTVRESLHFSASLRHPSAIYSQDKLENTVGKIIHQIGLDLCADVVVGKRGKGDIHS
jgi:ATP-binding cassette subfamily G (WHITE) protein 2 (PDR)